MLEKRDRGRGADASHHVAEYGSAKVRGLGRVRQCRLCCMALCSVAVLLSLPMLLLLMMMLLSLLLLLTYSTHSIMPSMAAPYRFHHPPNPTQYLCHAQTPSAAQIATRVEGAEMLEEALRQGRFDEDGELISEGEEGGSGSELEFDSGGEEEGEEGEEEELAGLSGDEGGEEEEMADGSESEGWSSEEEGEEEEEGSGSELELEEGEEEEAAAGNGSEEEEAGSSDEEGERRRKRQRTQAAPPPRKAPQAGSIAQLKKALAAKAAAAAEEEAAKDAEGAEGVPLEWGRILTEEDFDKIRQLKHRKMVDAAMQVGGWAAVLLSVVGGRVAVCPVLCLFPGWFVCA